jgi:hypothetical protein
MMLNKPAVKPTITDEVVDKNNDAKKNAKNAKNDK